MEPECTENTEQVTVISTMDLSVKTLDSRTHQFNDLDVEITVPGFKAHISDIVGVPSEQQRLIFRGRVLQDDKKLKDYNVASGQVIHLVTRTSASTANDTPPPPNVNLGSGGGPSIMMGPLGSMDFSGPGVTQSSVRRRNSAAVRLQVANENLTRASGMLKTLEEEIVLLEQQSNSNQESQGRETPSLSEELDSAIHSTLGGPTAAALVATISESQSGNSDNTHPNQQTANQPRLPAPMLQELATSIEDYLNVNSRLVPFLQTLQRWLRENTELVESQRDQVQYTYDTLSAVLHALSHTLHAISDITIDFSLPPENRRLRAPPSILVGQSTVVRAAIPIGIGIEGLPIQVTSTSTSSLNINPSVTVSSQNSGNQNPTLPTAAFQGGSIQFPAGISFGPGMTSNVQFDQGIPEGANVQFGSGMGQGINVNVSGSAQNRPQAQGMGGLQQAIAAALQAFGNNAGARPQGGVMLGPQGGVMLGPFSASVPVNTNAPVTSASGQAANTTTSTSPPVNTTTSATQGNNAAQDHFRSLLGSLSPQHRPYDLLLQCRSHHHLRTPENRPARPVGLVSFLSEQRTDKENVPHELGDDTSIFQTFFGLLEVVNPLRPIIAQYIRSTLLRGRDSNNRSHVSTAVRFHARRLVAWLTEPLKLTNDEETIRKLSQDLIEVLTELLSQCVEVILMEPTDSSLLTSHFARLIGEQMPRVRAILQEAFGVEGYTRVLKGLVLMGINALFPQSSLLFRTQVTRAVSGYLETVNYIPDDEDEETEEEGADMEIDIDVRIDDQSENDSYQEAQESLVANISTPIQPEPPQPEPQVTLTNQIPDNDEIHSESDLSDLETEFVAASAELFQNVPDAWRNTLLRDIQRQEQLRESGPEPLSNEFLALFPQK